MMGKVIIESENELDLRPITETIFDMRGIIQVEGPQDLEAVLEETKRRVAQKIVESNNE